MRLRSLREGSAKAAVLFSTRTLKPSASSMPEMIPAHSAGSWPLQPPQTMSASRIEILLRKTSAEPAAVKIGSERRRTFRPRRHLDVPALLGGAGEGLHDLQHMERQVAAGPVRAIFADRQRHVGNADAAIIAVGIGHVGGDLGPAAALAQVLNDAAEMIWVGHDECALRAVDLERHVPVPGHVK